MIWALPFLLLFLLVLWGTISSNLIIKIPRLPLDANPKTFGYEFEPFTVETEDNVEIRGWFVPARARTRSAVVVLHGWGANKSDVVASTIFLADRFHLAYFDFRNHGNSGGNATSLTCAEIRDLAAVLKHLKARKSPQIGDVAAYGFSMGASVALSAAARMTAIKAVIAESPFTSYNAAVTRFAKLFYGIPKAVVPVTLIFARLRLGFDPEECSPVYHVSRISPRPVLIIQAGNDARMPATEGQILYDLAKEPKELWLVPEADHGTIAELAPQEYRKKILGFYEKWLKG